MQQLYLTTPFAPPIRLENVGSDENIFSLRSFVSNKYEFPPEILIFSFNSHVLSDKVLLSSLNEGFIHLNFALKGGKGGFGSLLRGQAATKRKTTNFDASKDLKGRRMRNVENEKKLREFLRKKREEDDKVQKELKEYKDLEQKQRKLQYEIKLTQEYKSKLEDWENKMGESISVGLKKLRPLQENQVNDDNRKHPLISLHQIIIPSKDSLILQKTSNNEEMQDETISFSIPKKKIHIDSQINNLYQESSNFIEESKKEIILNEEPKTIVNKPVFAEIDLKNVSSIEDIEMYGAEHIKEELNRLGLKCGGNLRERAQRLFDIKKDPTNLFNPKYLAKTKK